MSKLAEKHWFQVWALPFVGVIFFLTITASSISIALTRKASQDARRELCNAINHNRTIMREIVTNALDDAQSQKATPDRKAEIKRLHADLRLIVPADCNTIGQK